MSWLIRDLRYGLRESIRRPGFTWLAILTFALGIGFVTAMYSVILSGAGKGEGGGLRHGGLRNLLVVAEVALSLVLLVGAGALMRSFLSMMNLDLGFNPHNIVSLRPRIPNATPVQQRHFVEAATSRLGSLPGVISATATTGLPPYGGIRTELDVVGKTHSEQWRGVFEACDERYFSTVGFRFLGGRSFSQSDVANSRKFAVVNQTLVSRYLGRENPIGKHVRVGFLSTSGEKMPDPVFEIIGVVADIRNRGLEEASLPEVFIPIDIYQYHLPHDSSSNLGGSPQFGPDNSN